MGLLVGLLLRREKESGEVTVSQIHGRKDPDKLLNV
jgi:hypothetical protein